MPYIEGRQRDYTKLGASKWYHGTTMKHLKSIKEKGVIANINIGFELDFGHGFYLTPEKKQAAKYIKDRVEGTYLDYLGLTMIPTDNTPIVLEFEFRPFDLFDKKEAKFGFLPTYDDRFAEFVFHNRYYNVDGEAHHDFDIIYGVMSDSIPTILIQKYKNGEIDKQEVIENLKKSTSAKQLSIHKQDICDIINLTNVYKVDMGKELLSHD